MSRNNRFSEFAKSLGRYRTPKPGETLDSKYGKAKVLRVLPYDEVINEMRRDGVPGDEIDRFDLLVLNFLGDKKRYFECELSYPNGEVDHIDWSEYLALKNRRKR